MNEATENATEIVNESSSGAESVEASKSASDSSSHDEPLKARQSEGSASNPAPSIDQEETLAEPKAKPSVAPTSGPASASVQNGGTDSGEASGDARTEVERYKEQWIRTAADFDNYRKRSRREVDDARKAGREELLRELLPVFDNLERGVQSAQRATEVKPVVDGLGMILKQFGDTIGRLGIKKVASVGVPFDPSVHEAIQQVESADHEPGTVLAEVQPGYVQGDRLVRAALVVVSKAPSGEATEVSEN